MAIIDGKVLVWVDANIAHKLKVVNDVLNIKEEEIKPMIQKLKDDISDMEDWLDDDLASFRLHAQKARNTYKKVVEEEMEATYELWEKMSDLRSETREKLDKTRELTKSVKHDICQINESLKNCSIWGLNDLMKLVEKVNSMPDRDRDLLVQLVELKRNKAV